MEMETITRIKLTSTDGMILTNGETFGRVIYLASGETADNWHEITEEEYNEIRNKTLEETDYE